MLIPILAIAAKRRCDDATDELGDPNSYRITVERVIIYPQSGNAYLAGRDLGLSPFEFDLLHHILRNRGRLISAADISLLFASHATDPKYIAGTLQKLAHTLNTGAHVIDYIPSHKGVRVARGARRSPIPTSAHQDSPR